MRDAEGARGNGAAEDAKEDAKVRWGDAEGVRTRKQDGGLRERRARRWRERERESEMEGNARKWRGRGRESKMGATQKTREEVARKRTRE